MKQTDCFRKKMGDGDARCRRGDRGRNKRSVGRQRAIMETCGCCLARATKLEIWFQNAVLPSLPVIQLGFSTTWWDTFGWSGHSPTRRAIKEIESKNYIYWLAPICPVLDCYFDVILLKSGALKVARLLKHRSGYYKLVRISVGYLRLTAFFFLFQVCTKCAVDPVAATDRGARRKWKVLSYDFLCWEGVCMVAG